MNPEHQSKLHEMRTQHQNVKTDGEVERSTNHAGTFEQEHTHHHIHETSKSDSGSEHVKDHC